MAAVVGVIGGVLGLWTLAGWMPTRGVEKPAYQVLQKAKGYEIREYAPCIRAEVSLEGGYRETLYDGFRTMADYIFGKNTPNAKIAMTAPVLQERSEQIAMTAPVLQEGGAKSGLYTVAFVMPRSYSIDSLPKPNDPDIRLRQVPKSRVAVLRFGGYATEKRAARKIERLRALLAQDGVAVAGTPIVAQYNPPWMPPYMRHNEIQIPLP